MQPIVIPRSEHNITRANISKNALKVLYRLVEAGFEAYLVGGGVRDLLLGLQPKDFDLATNCKPEQIRKLFRNCVLVGKRFRLAHIIFGREVIEVTTFRGHVNSEEQRQFSVTGMLLRDNVYGTLEEDVWRRDITINALYYNIKDFTVIDYTGGLQDLKNRVINIIGDPEVRYHEDPVRMIRAVRLAAKLGFSLTAAASDPMVKLAGLLKNVSATRLLDEVIKWFHGGRSANTFNLLREYGLFQVLFPQVEEVLHGGNADMAMAMLEFGFNSTDTRVSEEKPLNCAFLFAALLWWPLQQQINHYLSFVKKGEVGSIANAFNHAMHAVFERQKQQVLITQRVLLTVKEIWVLQYRFTQRRKKKIYNVLNHRKFRAAFDFLILRAQSGEDVGELVTWWSNEAGY